MVLSFVSLKILLCNWKRPQWCLLHFIYTFCSLCMSDFHFCTFCSHFCPIHGKRFLVLQFCGQSENLLPISPNHFCPFNSRISGTQIASQLTWDNQETLLQKRGTTYFPTTQMLPTCWNARCHSQRKWERITNLCFNHRRQEFHFFRFKNVDLKNIISL